MAKKESTFLNMTITLLLVTGIASLALSSVYNLTKEPIAIAKEKKLKAAIGLVIPGFDKLNREAFLPDEAKDSLVFYHATNSDKHIGTAVETYTDLGFSGRIKVMVGFLPDGTIHDATVLEHKETPGLGDKMQKEKSDFTEQFKGKHPESFKLFVTKDNGEVDAITAATISSRAFCEAVRKAYASLKIKGGQE